MRTVTYRLADLEKKVSIHIGRLGENEVTRVQIDAGSLFAEYPDAVASMSVENPEGVKYPATVTRDGDMVIWDVRDSDLAKAGHGEIQWTFTENGAILKSAIARTSIGRSIVGDGTPPDPLEDWIEHAEDVLEQVDGAFPKGGSAGQVLAKKSGADYDTEWTDQTGGGGTGDYEDLENLPKIGGVELKGDKSLHDLGAAAEIDIPDVSGFYTKPGSGIPASDLADGVIPDVSGFYTKPAGGIPASDLADGVIPDVSGFYTKPSGGIPASDIADGVIPDPEDLIDDTAGSGDTEKVWSADKSSSLLRAIQQKQDAPATAGTSGQVLGLNSNLEPEWKTVSGGGTVDSSLSTTSNNPVKNSVITNTLLSAFEGVQLGRVRLNLTADRFARKTGNDQNVNAPKDSTTRIMSIPYIQMSKLESKKIYVVPKSGYKWIIYQSDGTNYVQNYWSYAWSSNTETVEIDGRATEIVLLIAKSDNGTITTGDFDKVEFYSCYDYGDRIDETNERTNNIANLALDEVSLTWSQGSINPTTGADQGTNTRIRTPYVDVGGRYAIDISVENGYRFVVDYYDSNYSPLTDVNKHGTWVSKQEESYNIPSNVKYIRLLMSINDDDAISTSAGANLTLYTMDNVVYQVKNLDDRMNGVEFAGLGNAFSAMKNFNTGTDAQRNLHYLPAFVHTSDPHEDAERFERVAMVTKYLGADALLASGDFTNEPDDQYDYVTNAATKYGIHVLPCIGNHDAKNKTAEFISEKFIAPFEDDFDMPDGVTNPTYYSKDFDNKKIRVITVDQFQGQTASGSYDHVHFTQEQITWFVNTLLDTPEGYGIIVMSHSPEETPVADATYTKFKQTRLWYSPTNPYRVLTEIVDAFISGGTLSKTYNNDEGSTPETFTVSADFSTKNTGVEFIAFVNGHLHADNITYMSNTTNKVLSLNVCLCSANQQPYLAGLSDLGRAEKGITQDAFNLYVIDRATKSVRVVRIGADQPYTLNGKRDYMVIPYAD